MKEKVRRPSLQKSSIMIRRTSDGSVTYIQPLTKQVTQMDLNRFKEELNIDDHYITLESLTFRYRTSIETGLTKSKAIELLKQNGPNCLIAPATQSKWIVLLHFLFGGFESLLWMGAILSFVAYGVSYSQNPNAPLNQVYLGCMLLTTVMFTGLFGFYQESVNAAIMESFKNMIPSYATVVRDGETMVLPSEELVIGDLVQVKAGDIVPADIRIIDSKELKVDNSSITGESEPQHRTTECTDRNPLETSNLAFYGTNVVEGAGAGIVIACGDNTLMGHIAGLTSSLVKEETPMKRELKQFIKWLSIVSLIQGLIFLALSLMLGYNFFQSFTFFIAIIVANVPEGLLVTLTACLTLTAKRMHKKNCLVKNLQAIETLGSTSVICSDKTGTLTQNKMTVAHIYYDLEAYEVLHSFEGLDKTASFMALARVGTLCLRAEFKPDQDDVPVKDRQCFGDASESAVLRCMEQALEHTHEFRTENKKVFEIPFNSVNKYQISVHLLPTEEHLLVMKGAPENILPRCTTAIMKGQDIMIDEKALEKGVLQLAYKGERVLGFADLTLDKEEFPVGFHFAADNVPVTGLRFVGLMSLIDPPRPSVPSAVETCRSAGIRVIMVTGDHPITAMAIAKKVGIISSEIESVQKSSYDFYHDSVIRLQKACVLTGANLRKMTKENIDNIIQSYEEIVFARTSPQQKLQIVESFQRNGEIVAVTGDGVNDSPALKKGDIGIAMGISGSDVTKEAADMILLDDNFSSIVTGIEEGRLIFDNLKKSIAYVLTSNVPEMIPFILFVTLNIPQSLSIMAIIAINTGTDLWPAISLGYEEAEADIMKRRPRNPATEKLVNMRLIFMTYGQIGIIQTCASFASFFIMMGLHGFLYDRLFGLRKDWTNHHINDLLDSYGEEWTYAERVVLSNKCYAAFFLAVVCTQIADLLVCKTRRLSLFQQGMRNWVMNCGLIFEVCLAGLIVYCPGLNDVFMMSPVEWYTFVPAVPFAIIILAYDECRKYMIRKYPGGFVERETYY